MKKNHSKTILIITTFALIALSIINIIKILYYNDNIGIFGYISFIANALGVVVIIIDWLKIKTNKITKDTIHDKN